MVQTKKADEIIIVEAGSTDNTLSEISKFETLNSNKIPKLKIIKYQNSTIAQGRNTGIEIASGDIVAITDAGCIAKQDWLELITQPFYWGNQHLRGVQKHTSEVSIGLVAGFYEMPFTNPIQEVGRVYLGVPPERFDTLTFLPSARSVAFRKTIWESVGGFNEKLERGGEDTQFFYDCVKNNVKIARVEEAKVEWKEIETMNLKTIANKFYVYAKGDGQAGIWWHPSKQLSSHNIKISTIYLRYILGISYIVYCILHPELFVYLLICIFAYLIWPIAKWRDVVKNWRARLWLPVMQIISDIQVMRGFFAGVFLK